jgi:hypothetical protein
VNRNLDDASPHLSAGLAVLASRLDLPSHIAVDSRYVYWERRGVMRLEK